MRTKRLPCGGLVVLRADGQNDAAFAEIQRRGLYGSKRLTAGITLLERDSIEAIVADHPTPNRVVEIEDQAFARLSPHRP